MILNISMYSLLQKYIFKLKSVVCCSNKRTFSINNTLIVEEVFLIFVGEYERHGEKR